MTTRIRLLLLATPLVLVACRRSPPPELWIIPKGYVGWLRLDYSVEGQSPLPVENGSFVVRMPPEARLRTSTAIVGAVRDADIEYAVDGPGGRERLPSLFPKLIHPSFGVQFAYSASRGYIGSRKLEAEYTCVFVGTPPDFEQNGRDCG